MTEEIKPHGIYTTKEAQVLLKVSSSTMKRMIKRGVLRANKLSGSYRILGKEILSAVSPDLEKKSIRAYLGVKKSLTKVINKW